MKRDPIPFPFHPIVFGLIRERTRRGRETHSAFPNVIVFYFEMRQRMWSWLPPVILRRSRRCTRQLPPAGLRRRSFSLGGSGLTETLVEEQKSRQLNSERGYKHGCRRQLPMKVWRRREQRSLREELRSDFSACASLFNLVPFP